MKKNKGFTLIELVNVVIIIGIVIAAIVPLWGQWSKKEKTEVQKTEVQQVPRDSPNRNIIRIVE